MLDLNHVPQGGTGDQLSLAPKVDLFRAIQAFRSRIAEAGYGTPEILADGKIHRFQLADERWGKESGWYVFFPDTFPGGQFGSWKEESEVHTFFSLRDMPEYVTLSNKSNAIKLEAEQKFREYLGQSALARTKEKRDEADKAAKSAVATWAEAQPVPIAKTTMHSYLSAKGVPSFGLRIKDDTLLVPIINKAGELRGLQRIFSSGEKRFLPGMEKKGNFFWLTGEGDIVYICEGYATAASLYMATGSSVVAAMDCGNLAPVAQEIRSAMPAALLVIAADNDQWNKKNGMPFNPGLEAAYKTAREVGAEVVFPEFKDVSGNPTDFNDLHQKEGLEAVRLQAAVAGKGPRIADWGIRLFSGEAPETKWLVKETLPLAAPCLLAASGGTGKGMLALDLALTVAGKASPINLNADNVWLGKEVNEHGAAVIFTAEDSRESIHQRLQALDPTGQRRRDAEGRLFIIPLPNAGGPIQLVVNKGLDGFCETETFTSIKRQLRRIPNLKFINIDPLASFVAVDVNADPQAGQYTNALLASLAEETGACVLVAHHMSKPSKNDKGPEAARNAIRGTSALVDGVRCALAIWQASPEAVKRVQKNVDGIIEKDVFECAVVKSNAPADTNTKTLLRDKTSGLLRIVETYLTDGAKQSWFLEDLLVNIVKEAASVGRPFTKTGGTGLYDRREELPTELMLIARNRMEDMAQKMLEEGRIVKCTYGKAQAKFLDVPTGNFANGTGIIEAGFTPLQKFW